MKPLIIAVISLLFFTFTANAQNVVKKTPKLKNTKHARFEVGGEIFFTSTSYHREENGFTLPGSNEAENIFMLKASAGIFVINGLKLGIEPAVTVHRYRSNYTWTQVKLYFSPEYVLNTKTILYPYIGGLIGYTFAKTSGNLGTSYPTQDGISYGAKCGLKINTFGNSLLNIGLSFYSEHYDYNYSPFETNIEVKQRFDILGVTLGWSVFF